MRSYRSGAGEYGTAAIVSRRPPQAKPRAPARLQFRPMAQKKSVQLSGVVVVQTELSSIDAERGVLMYRGYDIADLAQQASYEEVAHLLLEGELPNAAELDA